MPSGAPSCGNANLYVQSGASQQRPEALPPPSVNATQSQSQETGGSGFWTGYAILGLAVVAGLAAASAHDRDEREREDEQRRNRNSSIKEYSLRQSNQDWHHVKPSTWQNIIRGNLQVKFIAHQKRCAW
jgi:hypothetical protein